MLLGQLLLMFFLILSLYSSVTSFNNCSVKFFAAMAWLIGDFSPFIAICLNNDHRTLLIVFSKLVVDSLDILRFFFLSDWFLPPRFLFLSGYSLLRDPRHNKGLAFTEKERDSHYLRGLLPPVVVSQELQVCLFLLLTGCSASILCWIMCVHPFCLSSFPRKRSWCTTFVSTKYLCNVTWQWWIFR